MMKNHLKIRIYDDASLIYILHFTYCPRTVFSLKRTQSESQLQLKKKIKKKKGSIWFFPLRYLLHHMSKQSNYMTKSSNITLYLNSVHTLAICTTSEMFWSYPFSHVFKIPTWSSELLFTSNTSDYYHHIPG